MAETPLPLIIIVITVFVLSSWGLLQYFFEFDTTPGLKSLFKTHHFPIIASLGNPNFLSEFLLLAAPVTFSLMVFSKKYYIVSLVLIMQGLQFF